MGRLGTGRLWYGPAEIHENRSTVGREVVLSVAETLLIFNEYKIFTGVTFLQLRGDN